MRKNLYTRLTYPKSFNIIIENKGHKIAGQVIPNNEFQEALKMKKDLANDKVFIYPTNVALYDFFNQKPATRFFFFNGEKTIEIEKQVIEILKNNKYKKILYFTSYAQSAQGILNDWIKNNSLVLNTYFFNNNIVELRLMKNSF